MADQDRAKEFPLLIKSKDVSGGLNTHIYPTEINDNQVQLLQNFEVTTPGLISKLEGTSVFSQSDNTGAVRGVGDFNPDTGASRVFMKAELDEIYSISSGGTSTLRATVSSSDAQTSFVQGLNKMYVSNGSDFPVVFDTALAASHLASAATAAPRFTTGAYFLNRLWFNDTANKTYVHYSNALADLFDLGTQTFKFGEGEGDSEVVGLKPFRNRELLVFMKRRIEQIVVVDPTDDTTWERKVIDERYGCAAPDTIVEIGGVVYFMDNEYKIRALNRTALDANKGTQALPISHLVDDDIADRINKTHASKASAGYYRDFYLISFPQDDATENSVTYAFDVTENAWSGPFDIETAAKFMTSQIRGQGNEELFSFGTATTESMRWFDSTYTASGASYSSVLVTKKYDFGRPESDKIFADIEIAVLGTGEGEVTVEARVDQAEFTALSDKSGIMQIVSGSPTLPVNLPFSLGSTGVVREKFQLEEFSRGRNIDFRITHKGQGNCQILETIITALDENYESEII